MTNQGTLALLDWIDAHVPQDSQRADDRAQAYRGPFEATAHVRWMLGEVRGMIQAEVDPGKIQRWVGFMQGVLWTSGMASIAGLRDATRRALDD